MSDWIGIAILVAIIVAAVEGGKRISRIESYLWTLVNDLEEKKKVAASKESWERFRHEREKTAKGG